MAHKRNIPYSLTRRIRGIVLKQKDIRLHSYQQLRKRLIVKKYPRQLIDDALKKAESTPRHDIIQSGDSGINRSTWKLSVKAVYKMATRFIENRIIDMNEGRQLDRTA